MKKKSFILPIAAIALISGLGLCAGQNLADKPTVSKASSGEHIATVSRGRKGSNAKYIDITEFTCRTNGTDEISFSPLGRNDIWWAGRSFNAISPFVSTIERWGDHGGEAWQGTFTSPSFTQNGDYVSFTVGGNAAGEVKIYDETSSTLLTTMHPTFKDAQLSNNMILKYFKVPAGSVGHTLHVEVVDNTSSGFGGIVFGNFQHSQSLEDVARTFSVYLNNLSMKDRPDVGDADKNSIARTWILNYVNGNEPDGYQTDCDYQALMNCEISEVDEGFEDGKDSLNFWAFDYSYCDSENGATNMETYNGAGIDCNTSIATVYNHTWQEKMPYNKTGDYYFKGWHNTVGDYDGREPSEDSGAIAGDQWKYRLLSPEFTLKADYISVKMGGRTASVHILTRDASNGNLNLVKFYDNANFADVSGVGNMETSGFNTNTMVRHVLDVRAFKNTKIIIGLADWGDAGWGAVNYDELITSNTGNPTFQVDAFYQDFGDGVWVTRKDRYLHNGEDSTAVKQAYDFLQSYYSVMRSGDNSNSYCTIISSSEVGEILTAYEALSADAKAIVDASEDYCRAAGSAEWSRREVIKNTVGESIEYVLARRSIPSGLKSMLAINQDGSGLLLFLVVLSASVATIVLVLRLKKKKASK